MSRRKRAASPPPTLRYQGSLEIAGLWFEGVRVAVDRTASLAISSATGYVDVDDANAPVLARLTAEPAMLTIGNSVQMEIILTPDPARPGRFAFEAVTPPEG